SSKAEPQFVLTVRGPGGPGRSGSSNIANSFSTLTPTVFIGKGFGDLPDSMAWLRAGMQPAHHLVFRWRSEGPPHPPGMGPPGGIRAADAAQRAARRAD